MLSAMFPSSDSDSDTESSGATPGSKPAGTALAPLSNADSRSSDAKSATVAKLSGYTSTVLPNLTLRVVEDREQGLAFHLWPAATALCRHLERVFSQNPADVRGKRMLELGAGCGLVGMLAAAMGARVVITDLPDVVQHLQRNIEASFGTESSTAVDIRADHLACALARHAELNHLFRWGEPCTDRFKQGDFDYLLLADCIYLESTFRPLVRTLRSLCTAQTVVLIAQSVRRARVQNKFLRRLDRRFRVEFLQRVDNSSGGADAGSGPSAKPGSSTNAVVHIYRVTLQTAPSSADSKDSSGGKAPLSKPELVLFPDNRPDSSSSSEDESDASDSDDADERSAGDRKDASLTAGAGAARDAGDGKSGSAASSQLKAPRDAFTSTVVPGLTLLVVEQRSRGLAFQLWPAALVLCQFVEKLHCSGASAAAGVASKPSSDSAAATAAAKSVADSKSDAVPSNVDKADSKAADLSQSLPAVGFWSGKRVLELGAGCGLVSMLAAALGARVTVTDMPDVVPHLKLNIEASLGSNSKLDITATDLSWGTDHSKRFPAGSFDYILLADCIYYETLFAPLFDTLVALAGPQTTIFVSQTPRRNKVERRFFKLLAKRFDLTVVERTKPDANARQFVHIYRATLRPQTAAASASATPASAGIAHASSANGTSSASTGSASSR